ncbi:hypothetical protein F5Y17DRAFT_103559 [Xylariaceae sp. FL0594]|nr:hypothetical protein F5Y17DRAFT_103559 [Xylariaceae sp. FL0594]
MAYIGWSLILASVLYIAIRRPPFVVNALVSLCQSRGSQALPPPTATKEGRGGVGVGGGGSEHDVPTAALEERTKDDDGSEPPRTEPLSSSETATATIPNSNPSITTTEEAESPTTPKATATATATAVGKPTNQTIPSFSLSSSEPVEPPRSAAAGGVAHASASPPALPQPATISSTTAPPRTTSSMPPPPIPRMPRLKNPTSASTSASSSSLAPPPRPSPIPDRMRQAQYDRQPGTSTLAPPPSHSSVPPKPSRKVTLGPGHSPLDWARLANNPLSDLRNLGPGVITTGYLRVTPSMLRRQTGRKGKDAWTALGGKVYNVTPYLPFHPGGEPELLRAAGRDGTRLFGEIHPWVNYENMLSSCLIGLVVDESEAQGSGDLDAMD